MNRILGYILMIVGLVGCFYFLTYEGHAIPLQELWFVLCIFSVIAGVYFWGIYKLRTFNNQYNLNSSQRLAEIDRLKRTGDRIKVTLDNAEVKSRSYQEEIIRDGFPSRMEMLDALYDDNRNYKSQEIRQTYIVLYKKYNGKMYKFVSRATGLDAVAVKMYIEKMRWIFFICGSPKSRKLLFRPSLHLMWNAGGIVYAVPALKIV